MKKNFGYSFVSFSASGTKKFAMSFARRILSTRPGKHGLTIALEGELGSGKTTFAQGFAQGLGMKEKLLSPTFLIMKRFQMPSHQQSVSTHQFKYLYHLDCYRIEKPEELLGLGWKEIVSNPCNLALVEWPERVRRILPKDTVLVRLSIAGKNNRTIEIRELVNIQSLTTHKNSK